MEWKGERERERIKEKERDREIGREGRRGERVLLKERYFTHCIHTFSHSDSSNGRVREDNSWDVAVVQLGSGLIAKETVSQLTTSSNGNCIKY